MTAAGDATLFLVAGYGLTWLALFVYGWRVERRLEDARRAVDSMSEDEHGPGDHPGGGDAS